MTSLSLAAFLQITLLATGADTDTYVDAHQVSTETGRPLVVLVGADWCPACVEMKRDVIPEVRRRGALKKVAFAAVNLDKERKLGMQLAGGGAIPQLIMYRRTVDGWKRRKLIGGQSAVAVEHFIQKGVELDEIAKKAEAGRATPVSHEQDADPAEPVTNSPLAANS